jgi:hypothetical protein
MASHKAKAIQQKRDEAEIQNHKERVAWLSQGNPSWSCGTAVTASDQTMLLLQSRQVLRQHGVAHG